MCRAGLTFKDGESKAIILGKRIFPLSCWLQNKNLYHLGSIWKVISSFSLINLLFPLKISDRGLFIQISYGVFS